MCKINKNLDYYLRLTFCTKTVWACPSKRWPNHHAHQNFDRLRHLLFETTFNKILYVLYRMGRNALFSKARLDHFRYMLKTLSGFHAWYNSLHILQLVKKRCSVPDCPNNSIYICLIRRLKKVILQYTIVATRKRRVNQIS